MADILEQENGALDLQVTCALLKPDAVRRGLVQQLIEECKDTGVLAIKEMFRLTFTSAEVDLLYADHIGKFYFEDNKKAICSGPAVVMYLEGYDAVDVVLRLKDHIREKYKTTGGPFNLFHCSDSKARALMEVRLTDQFRRVDLMP